jgi:hypothetical protein
MILEFLSGSKLSVKISPFFFKSPSSRTTAPTPAPKFSPPLTAKTSPRGGKQAHLATQLPFCQVQSCQLLTTKILLSSKNTKCASKIEKFQTRNTQHANTFYSINSIYRCRH